METEDDAGDGVDTYGNSLTYAGSYGNGTDIRGFPLCVVLRLRKGITSI
jgi:hypothetical protein